MITQTEIKAALAIAIEVARAIKEAGSIPSGHLYAVLMGRMSLEQYDGMIRLLVNQGLIRQEPSHLLVWIAA